MLFTFAEGSNRKVGTQVLKKKRGIKRKKEMKVKNREGIKASVLRV